MTARQAGAVFAATLRVSPAPDSLICTNPILRKLNSYGEVKSFRKAAVRASSEPTRDQRPDEESNYRVIFSSESDLTRALVGSPFNIDVDHNLPNPEGVDPYNVFGLQDRKRPEPRSFTCDLRRDQDESLSEADTRFRRVRLVKDLKSGPLFRGLLDGNVPLGQLEGLATSVEPIPSDESAPELNPFRLMEMYRSALNAKDNLSISDAPSQALDDLGVKIRHPVTHKGNRHPTDYRGRDG